MGPAMAASELGAPLGVLIVAIAVLAWLYFKKG